MDLTPEERHRIYEEERARLEAPQVPLFSRQYGSSPPERSNPPPPLWKIILGIAVALAVALVVCAVLVISGVGTSLLWDVHENLREGLTNLGITRTVQQSAQVTYRATCDGPMEINYANATGGMNIERASVVWIKTVELPAGSLAYLTGQNQYEHGRVMVNIVCNGQEVKRSESNGAYAIASAAARCN